MTSAVTSAVTSTTSRIPHVTLSNGVLMPVLAAGVGGFNTTSATNSIRIALSLGFNSIDTAHDYNNFDGVAAAISKVPRSNFFLTTKIPGCGVPTQGLYPPCYNNTLKLSGDDLSSLDVTYVDLLLLHFPPLFGCKENSQSCKNMQEQWHAMEVLYLANKTRAIGVSNYCKECLQCILTTAKVSDILKIFVFLFDNHKFILWYFVLSYQV